MSLLHKKAFVKVHEGFLRRVRLRNYRRRRISARPARAPRRVILGSGTARAVGALRPALPLVKILVTSLTVRDPLNTAISSRVPVNSRLPQQVSFLISQLSPVVIEPVAAT